MNDANKYRIILDRDNRYDGSFFFAVKTTGIVCLPSCPAPRPLQKNVAYYDSLSAAVRDGFRPCKRCKPDDLAKTPIIQSLKIEDETHVSSLAQNLGISDRHLRRITHKQVGTSPHKLVQSQRILLARNLLTGTTLPIIDVAFSAGFTSLRQFNDSFKQSTSMTPSAYRKLHADPTVTLPETTEVTIRLHYDEPFEWLPLKNALLAHMIPGLENVDLQAQTLKRLIVIGNERYIPITIDLAEPMGALAVSMQVSEMRDINTVAAIIKRVFDLDSKPEAIRDVLGADPIVGPLLARHPGLRLCGMFDPFELLINTIIGQQVSIPAARTFSERLVKAYGKQVGDLYVYPSAKTLLQIDPQDFYQTTKLNHKKIATIQAVCQLIASGFELAAITTSKEARDKLLAVKGIGPWTVEYVILRGYGAPDGFPADDLFIKRNLGVKTARAAEEIAQRWRPYRGYATMQLWTKGAYDE